MERFFNAKRTAVIGVSARPGCFGSAVKRESGALVSLSWLPADHPRIRELDVNPLRVYSNGVLALDARIFVDVPSPAENGSTTSKSRPRQPSRTGRPCR